MAHDGQRAPIQLVDEKGCVVREKIMSPFKKVKNFDSTANVLSYAYFQVRHKVKNVRVNGLWKSNKDNFI